MKRTCLRKHTQTPVKIANMEFHPIFNNEIIFG
jgi:hypothetical protein